MSKKLELNGKRIAIKSSQETKTGCFPIFTETFIQYNVDRKSEFAELKKNVAKLRDTESLLEAKLDNIQNKMKILQKNAGNERGNISSLQARMNSKRASLVRDISCLTLPRTVQPAPTIQSVDEFLFTVSSLLTTNELKDHPDFVNSIYMIVSSLKSN